MLTSSCCGAFVLPRGHLPIKSTHCFLVSVRSRRPLTLILINQFFLSLFQAKTKCKHITSWLLEAFVSYKAPGSLCVSQSYGAANRLLYENRAVTLILKCTPRVIWDYISPYLIHSHLNTQIPAIPQSICFWWCSVVKMSKMIKSTVFLMFFSKK